MKFLLKSIVILLLIAVNFYIWYKVFDLQIPKPEVLSTIKVTKVDSDPAATSSSQTTPLPQIKIEKVDETVQVQTKIDPQLESVINKELEGTKGTYSVVIKNLKTGKTFYRDENRVYEAGSLYKLWVMATAYKKIEAGEIAEDTQMSSSIAELNRKFSIDPANAELTSGGITQTVSQAMTQMITISHNYSALLLADKLKLSQVKVWLEENGFRESKVGNEKDPPYITASEAAVFMEKLYKGEFANPEHTQKMLDLLKNQKKNNKLPKYLPKSTIIGHKTGEIGWFSHDAGIVFADNGDYIIVVMSESSAPGGAEDRIGLISKAVYEYFQKQ
jgi:beta-lactamase class A